MRRVLLTALMALATLALSLSGCVWGFDTYGDGHWSDGGGGWDFTGGHDWWSPSDPPSGGDSGVPTDPGDGGDTTWQPPNDDPFDDDGGGSNVPLVSPALTSG